MVRRRHCRSTCAVAALAVCLQLSAWIDSAHGQYGSLGPPMSASPYPTVAPTVPLASPYPTSPTAQQPVYPMTASVFGPNVAPAYSEALPPAAGAAPPDSWIEPTCQEPAYVDADVYVGPTQTMAPMMGQPMMGQPMPGEPMVGQPMIHPCPPDTWFWQLLPEGIIYRSYWAGPHEPRMGLVLFREDHSGNSFWDAALGGRVGLLRYGNADPLWGQGWQLDFEGAALPRLTLDSQRDLDSVDFRAGIPLTYGWREWQFKVGYYHLSSHMGDEYAIRNNALDERINYVRDAIVGGVSYYPDPMLRLYGEAAYAFNATGGAEPWEFQFGFELAKAGPTGPQGSPFLAANLQLLEEHNFGGALNTQAGWMWRSQTGRVLRIGAQYYNGKSSQYQFFDDSEEQIGGGVWYDF